MRKDQELRLLTGDVCFVAATADGKSVTTTNPFNEYSYARVLLDHERFVPVRNDAFRPQTALPFDLVHLRNPRAGASRKHRRPTTAAGSGLHWPR